MLLPETIEPPGTMMLVIFKPSLPTKPSPVMSYLSFTSNDCKSCTEKDSLAEFQIANEFNAEYS